MPTTVESNDDNDTDHKMDDCGELYVVVTTTYPTSYGCHRGRTWSQAEMIARSNIESLKEKFENYEDAVQAAREVRENKSEWFMEEEFEDDEYPPFDSAEMENYDNDEEVLIRVMKQRDFDLEIEEGRECLHLAQAKKHLEALQKKEMTRLQLLDSGSRVFYSRRYKEYQIPAQFEYEECEEKDKFVMPSNAESIPTLYYKVDHNESGKVVENYEESKHGKCNLIKLIAACKTLEELYLRSSGFNTEIGKDFLQALVTKAPHLSKTLRILSLTDFMLEPSALEKLGQFFPNLIRLDITGCLAMDYYSGDYCDDEENLPYDDPLMSCLEHLKHLKRLDLGYEDPDMRNALYRYALSYHVLHDAKELICDLRKGRITFDDDNMPEPFSSCAREKAAKQEALSRILANKENHEKYPAMVNLALREFT